MKPFCVILAFALCLGSTFIVSGQEKEPAKTKTDLQTLVEGNNEFAFDLYARLRKKPGNIIFSPYSISSALAMTYAGAHGKTAEKVAKVMHFRLPQDRLHPAFAQLNAELNEYNKIGIDFCLANALWCQQEFNFRQEFLDLTKKHHGAAVQKVDFIKESEQARSKINQWVSLQTKGVVNDLLPSDSINEATRVVLTNALYMKAGWGQKFAPDRTKNAPFELLSGKQVSVQMMHHPEKELHFNYHVGDGCQWLELPYSGSRLAMVLILPNRKGQLPNVESALTPAMIQKGIAGLSKWPGIVILPRFKANLLVALTEHLREMGLEKSELTHISEEILVLSDIRHQAFVEVNEEGTTAAAGTGAIVVPLADKRPFTFNADHPFLFLIRDTRSGMILFLGRVTDPSRS